jgi:adenosylcobinamide-GDP ribazoletransferase
MPPWVRGGRAAIVFLTRVPVGGFPYVTEDFRWAAAWFPAVGAAIGLVMAAVLAVAAPLGPTVASWLAIGASLLVTGGFHEDGLADTADALGGGYTADRVLEILKDSRIGAFGGMALVVSLSLRAALMSTCSLEAVVAGEALSRLFPVLLMVRLPYVTSPDKARSDSVRRVGAPQVIGAGLASLAVASLALAFGLDVTRLLIGR